MKSRILLLAGVLVANVGLAQMKTVEYQYGNNSFSVDQQAQQLTNATTGKLFYKRLHAFDSFNRASLKPYLSRDQFYRFMEQMKEVTKIAKTNGYNNHVEALEVFVNNVRNLSRISNEDGFRYMLYEVSAPVYKVVDESWGNDVVDAVIQESYLRLYDYVRSKVASGHRDFAYAMEYLNMDPIKTDESMGECQFTVSIDEPVLKKNNIEVYFSDLALFKKISQKYEGSLLEGPISGWEAYADESNVVRSLLMAYEGERDIPAYYSYMYNLKEYGNPSTVQQNLYKDNKWFVWVFRDGKLYYSYMALPCSDLNKVTVYEERPMAGLEDPAATGYDDYSYE